MTSIERHKEVEFKYDANSVKLSDFMSLMKKIQTEHPNKDSLKYKEASSADIYYQNSQNEIVRLRNSKTPVLTIKRKTTEENNNHRIEVNLPVDFYQFGETKFEEELEAFCHLLSAKIEEVRSLVKKMWLAHNNMQDFKTILDAFLSKLEYYENFKIYKNCEIFWIEDVNFVYYKVLGKNMECLDNFIEIEYDEEKALDMQAEDCLEILQEWEKKLKPLGITKESRLTYSLYDKYKQPFKIMSK